MKRKNKEELNNLEGVEEQNEKEGLIVPVSNSGLITVDAFLSNSKEVKQKYNSYMPVGFRRHLDLLRQKDPNYRFRRTEAEWKELFEEFANN